MKKQKSEKIKSKNNGRNKEKPEQNIIKPEEPEIKHDERDTDSGKIIADKSDVRGDDSGEIIADKSDVEEKEENEGKNRAGYIIGKVFGTIEWLLLIAGMGLLIYIFSCTLQGRAASFFGYYILHVVTGSMEPTISVDDYITVHEVETDTLKENDIIAYYSEAKDIRGLLVIHRIININPDGTFVTKGDANTREDEMNVRPDQVLGIYVGRFWLLNWVVSFTSIRKLLMMLVIIPMFLISIYEVRTLGALMKEKKRIRLEEKDVSEETAKNESVEEYIERLKRKAVEEYIREHENGRGREEDGGGSERRES